MSSFGFDMPLVFHPPMGNSGDVAGGRLPGFALIRADEFDGIVPAWRDLCGRALEGNPFLHPGFLRPAIAAFGAGRVHLATVWGIDGRLLALAPVAACRLGRVVPAVALWCHDYGPRGAPLLDADMADHALSCLAVGICRQFGRTRPVIFPHVDLDGAFAACLLRLAGAGGRHVDGVGRHRRARFDRSDAGAGPRQLLDTRRRKEFARQMRRLAECGALTVTAERDAGRVAAAFEEFLDLEDRGWKGRRGTALKHDGRRLDFARAAVAGLARDGLCQIDAMRLDGRPAAMLVSLVAGDLAATWKIAYDERYARFSPGAQLMLEATRSLFDNPMVQRLDSLATADHPMIDRLWRGRSEIATLVLSPPDGSLPHQLGLMAARGEQALRRRLGPWARRRLAGFRQDGPGQDL